jgi:hypothetical protein
MANGSLIIQPSAISQFIGICPKNQCDVVG